MSEPTMLGAIARVLIMVAAPMVMWMFIIGLFSLYERENLYKTIFNFEEK